MRRVSKKRAALRREAAPLELEFLQQYPWCWYCGQRSEGIDHICRGAHRGQSLLERCTWVASCNACNTGEPGAWPVEKKLAYKLQMDPEHFSIEKVNQIRGRADTSITLAHVAGYLEVSR